MANRTKYGLEFLSTVGGSNTPNYVNGWVASAYANRINVGDVVKRVAGGSFELAAAGNAVFGVVAGIRNYYNGTVREPKNFLPAAATWTNEEDRSELIVIPAVGNYFWGTTDATSGTYNTEAEFRAMYGENIDVVQIGTPPASANYQLDISTHAAASGQFRIVGIHRNVDTDFTVAGVPLVVTGNELTTQWPGYVGTEAGV